MSLYCVYEFVKDKDLTEINTKRFNEESAAKHPQISLCHRTFLNDKLNELGEGINSSSVENFLGGLIWDDRMVNLSIDNTLFHLEDLISDSCLQSTLEGPCKNKGIFYHITRLQGFSCLSFQYPDMEEIEMASIWFKSPMDKDIDISRLWVLISFPYQTMKSATEFPLSLKNYSVSKLYEYNILLKGIEFSRHRNKRTSPCLEGEEYDLDSILEEEILSSVGCRPFFLDRHKKYPPCTSQAKMTAVFKSTMKFLTSDHSIGGIVPSCTEIDRISIDKDIKEVSNDAEIGWFQDMNGSLDVESVWFRISVIYNKQTYREIKQVRAYNVQSLIGNVGGYIGLFVGYSLSQLPNFFKNAYDVIVKKHNNEFN